MRRPRRFRRGLRWLDVERYRRFNTDITKCPQVQGRFVLVVIGMRDSTCESVAALAFRVNRRSHPRPRVDSACRLLQRKKQLAGRPDLQRAFMVGGYEQRRDLPQNAGRLTR